MKSEPAQAPSVEERVSAWLVRAQEFRPLGNEFPQVIQADDYETITSIEVLYGAVQALSRNPRHWPLLDPPEPLAFRVDLDTIVISGPTQSVSIEVDEQQVSFAGRSFRTPATITLFRTLHTLLVELTSGFAPVGVLGTQFATRAYGSFTRLHFSFGTLVVELEGAHSGRSNPERLYVLDLVRSSESLLWLRLPGATSE